MKQPRCRVLCAVLFLLCAATLSCTQHVEFDPSWKSEEQDARDGSSRDESAPPHTQCQPCKSHDDCPSLEFRCLIAGPSEEKACLSKCTTQRECPQGFSCGEHISSTHPKVCLPSAPPSLQTPEKWSWGCQELLQLGKKCEDSEDCEEDSSKAFCEDRVCTLVCSLEHGCPPGFACTQGLCKKM
ncbi:MAG: hypothetical protein CL920_35045 [Deltaproteobacteria bacterium]|nr:hypothetical protein [Deltaproteobacteria bacterium]